MSEDTYEAGLRIRRDVVGADYVDAALKRAEEDGFSGDFQRLVTEYCWGASWGRDALSRRDRSLLNLVILGTLGRNEEFKLHLRGAFRNGVTKDEVKDALIHLAIYAGIPAGVECNRLALEVFAAMESESAASDSI